MKSVKGFLLRDVVISGVLFFGIIALFVILVVSMSNNYNRPDIVNPSFSNNYNKLYVLTTGDNGIDVTQSSVKGASGLQLQGNYDIAFSSMWTVLNLVWATVDFYASMGSDTISDFTMIDSNVIKIVMYVLTMVLVTIVMFTIISSITRGRV